MNFVTDSRLDLSMSSSSVCSSCTLRRHQLSATGTFLPLQEKRSTIQDSLSIICRGEAATLSLRCNGQFHSPSLLFLLSLSLSLPLYLSLALSLSPSRRLASGGGKIISQSLNPLIVPAQFSSGAASVGFKELLFYYSSAQRHFSRAFLSFEKRVLLSRNIASQFEDGSFCIVSGALFKFFYHRRSCEGRPGGVGMPEVTRVAIC